VSEFINRPLLAGCTDEPTTEAERHIAERTGAGRRLGLDSNPDMEKGGVMGIR
jgi:hypothetical protein